MLGPVLDIAVPAHLKLQGEMKLLYHKKGCTQRAQHILKQIVDDEHQRLQRLYRIFKLHAFFKPVWPLEGNEGAHGLSLRKPLEPQSFLSQPLC